MDGATAARGRSCCLSSAPSASGRSNRGGEVTTPGLCHRGMRISESDWNVFLGHAATTLANFQVPEAERCDVVAFVQSLKKEIVE